MNNRSKITKRILAAVLAITMVFSNMPSVLATELQNAGDGSTTETNKIDVWDLGAEQLDSDIYNNMLNVQNLNAATYGESLPEKMTGHNLKSFTVGDLSFCDGGFSSTHRLRSTNDGLIRYDAKSLKNEAGEAVYQGYIYSNKGSTDGVYVSLDNVKAGDILTVYAASNGGDSQIVCKCTSDTSVETQSYVHSLGSSVAGAYKFYAPVDGNYKWYSATEKLCVARITREHTSEVTVSGTVTKPEALSETALLFTNTSTGVVTKAAVNADGTYSATLNEQYTYDIALDNANGFVISSDTSLSLAKNGGNQNFDVSVIAVELVKVEGEITGLTEEAYKALELSFVNEETIYKPEVTLSKDAFAYSVSLEKGVDYQIVAKDIDDYALTGSSTVKYDADATNALVFEKKPVYKVTIAPTGATLADLAAATFTFTRHSDADVTVEENYVYTFTGPEAIELRDGVYTVAVTNSGDFKQRLTSNVKVAGAPVEKAIAFDAPEKTEEEPSDETPTSWDFRTDAYTGQAEFNGLSITGGKKHSAQYGMSISNGTIQVPVKGACTIKVSVGYNWDITINGEQGEKYKDNTNSGDITLEYEYKGEAGTVEVKAGSEFTSYIKMIEVVYPISVEDLPTSWDFQDASYTGQSEYNGLTISSGTKHSYGIMTKNATIQVPVKGACNVKLGVGYNWDITIDGYQGEGYVFTSGDGGHQVLEYAYTGEAGTLVITIGSSCTSYIENLKLEYPADDTAKDIVLTVGATGCDYTTINGALDAVRKMNRVSGQKVIIKIMPGDYEEMLVIDMDDITLVNASETPSLGLKDKGVNIEDNAVRITSYYGHGYTYYSMGTDCKYSEEVLAVNKENGYQLYRNPGSGTTDGSYWNATVVIGASNFTAEGIIFENSFNQYVSKKAAEDVIIPQVGAVKEGSVPRNKMEYGDTTVQDKLYVERAAALAIKDNSKQVLFKNCKFVGRQDTLYGGANVTAAFDACSIYGGTDYIFGGMTAAFNKCDLVFNTFPSNSNDVGYITAAQQKSGRGYVFYDCNVTSTTPGVDTASETVSNPGYFGRPWAANTGEAVFVNTKIGVSANNDSLIAPAGWLSTLSAESPLSVEYGSLELAGVDNFSKRATWAKVLEAPVLADGTEISYKAFLGDWMPFANEIEAKAVVRAAAPTASVEGGLYTESKTVELSCTEENAEIYYTLDGTIPSATNGTKYEGAIVLDGEEDTITEFVIRAVAVVDGKENSLVSSYNYVISIPSTAVMVKKKGSIDVSEGLFVGNTYGTEGAIAVSVLADMPLKDGTAATVDGIDYIGFIQQPSANPSPNKGAIPTAGAAFVIKADKNGSISFVTKSAAKTYHFVDTLAGEIVKDNSGTSIPDGTLKFDLEAGHTYYFYADGSKVCVYGINYTYMAPSDYKFSGVDLTQGLTAGEVYGTDPKMATFKVLEDMLWNGGDANSATIDGKVYLGYVQGKNNPKINISESNPKGDNPNGVFAEVGAAVEITANSDGIFAVALNAAKNSNKNYYFVEKSGDTVNIIANNVAVPTKLVTYEIKKGNTYQFYVQGSKACIYEMYATCGTKPRADWETVATPVINTNEITTENGEIVVPFTMVIGDDGADAVTVEMYDAEGKLVASQITKSEGATGSVTFKPSASGKYAFVLKASRDDEADKITEKTEAVDFVLPLATATVKSFTNKKAGKVQIGWASVAEATGYYISAIEKAEGAVETEPILVDAQKNEGDEKDWAYTLTLECGKDYTVFVQAVRGEEKAAQRGTLAVNVVDREEFTWSYATFGSSVSTSKNGFSGNANDGEVRVWSTGNAGKIVPNSTDGLAFYYTTIDPKTENFTLTAKAHVNEWTFTNGQEGFGIMAADRVGKNGDGAAFWNNSYQAIISKVEYYWDGEAVTDDTTKAKYTMKLGVGSLVRTGVTPEGLIELDKGATIPSGFETSTKPLETSAASLKKPAGTYNVVGNRTNDDCETIGGYTDFILTIQKNNTGYFVSYTTPEGETVTQKYYDTEALSQLDDKVYVGFFAARTCDVTFSDISLTKIAPEDDELPEKKPVTYVTPNYRVVSGTVANTSVYQMDFLSNWNGSVIVRDAAGTEVLRKDDVKADEKVSATISGLMIGSNKFTITFAPAASDIEGVELSDYAPKTFTHSVLFRQYGEEGQALYVAPTGKATGNGTKDNPLDIYTAVKYVQPGQSIVLMDGTYKLRSTVKVERGINGTEEKPIYMVAEHMPDRSNPFKTANVVFDFGKTCAGMVLAGDYWYFKGFDVTNSISGQKGIQVSGNYNTLDQINTYFNGNTGIQIARYLTSDSNKADWPHDNLVLNCTSYLNADNGYEDADGFAAKLTIGEGNVFDGCIAAYNADDGWDLFAKAETGPIGRVEIRNSIAFMNGYVRRIGGDGELSLDGELVNAGNGNGFKMGGESITGYHTLKNSIAFNNKAKGIDSNSCPDIQVYNSISFNNGSYNVAFYTNNAKNTDYLASGVISYRKGTDVAEQFKLLGSQDKTKVENNTNFFWNTEKKTSVNAAGTAVADDWFVSLDADAAMAGGIKRNADGSIQTNGFLTLTEKGKEYASGTVIGGTPSGEVEDKEETNGDIINDKNDEITEGGGVDVSDVPEDGIIPDGLWFVFTSQEPIVYNGTAQKPEIHVYHANSRLTEGKDYSIKYYDNVHAYRAGDENFAARKSPRVEVTFKGQYTGKLVEYFDIAPVNFEDERINVVAKSVVANNKVQKVNPVVTFNGTTLGTKSDYVVSYPEIEGVDYKSVGTYDVCVTAKAGSNFVGSITTSYEIMAKSSNVIPMSSVTVSGIKDMSYTGDAIAQDIKVTYKKKTVDPKFYSVSYVNNVERGTASVIITGVPQEEGISYVGSICKTFKIKTYTLSASSVNIDGITYDTKENKATYKGSPITFKLKVTTKEGTELVENVDYKVTYSKNTTATSKASVKITGIGNYAGSITKYFAINAYDLGKDDEGLVHGSKDLVDEDGVSKISVSYVKGGATPNMVVTLGDRVLTLGKDYKVSYYNNTKPALATDTKAPYAKITGINGFKGSFTVKFTIEKTDLADAEAGFAVTAKDVAYSSSKKKATDYRSTVTVKDAKGKTLSSRDDYTVAYMIEIGNESYNLATTDADEKSTILNAIKKAGAAFEVTAVVTAKESSKYYTGSISCTYRVTNNKLLSDASVSTIAAKYYGNDTKLYAADFTYLDTEGNAHSKVKMKVGKTTTELVYGKDFEIVASSYVNNGKVGTASVTLRGIGAYAGTKTIKYTIKKMSCNIADATVLFNTNEFVLTDECKETGVTLSGEDITVILNGNELEYGKDYVIDATTYKNNKVKSTSKKKASVVIRGTGVNGGSKTISYKIVLPQ